MARKGLVSRCPVCEAGMALVEAGAFAYCLRSWRGMTGRSANVMALMIAASAVTFVVVLSPYIAANVSKIAMSKLLIDGWLLAWSVAVALSTILIIASVGYAQKRPVTRQATANATTGGDGATHRDTGARQDVTRSEFLTQWRANGHQSVAALAAELGVNVRTAQRWVKVDGKTQATSESTEE